MTVAILTIVLPLIVGIGIGGVDRYLRQMRQVRATEH